MNGKNIFGKPQKLQESEVPNIKSIANSYGHITRRLSANEPLKGKTLALALKVIDENYNDNNDRIFLDKLREKIKTGQQISDYECHIFLDSMLLHSKIKAITEASK